MQFVFGRRRSAVGFLFSWSLIYVDDISLPIIILKAWKIRSQITPENTIFIPFTPSCSTTVPRCIVLSTLATIWKSQLFTFPTAPKPPLYSLRPAPSSFLPSRRASQHQNRKRNAAQNPLGEARPIEENRPMNTNPMSDRGGRNRTSSRRTATCYPSRSGRCYPSSPDSARVRRSSTDISRNKVSTLNLMRRGSMRFLK
jgi:hypothetical protein